MKKLFMILPLVLVLCFTFSCQKGEEVAEEPAVDIAAEIEAVKEAFWKGQKAGAAKDAETLFSTVADDVMFSGNPPMDKAAAYEFYVGWFAKGRYWDNSAIDRIEVSASGDMAYVVFHWEYFRDEEGETSTGNGSNVTVYKKQADGTWKMVAI